jgi:hypothetical protein
MKWEKAGAYNLAAYKRVIDAYFSFPMRHKLPLSKSLDTHCVAVNTSKKTLKSTGDGDVEIGLRRAKITNPAVNTPWYRPRLTILHRDGTPGEKRK